MVIMDVDYSKLNELCKSLAHKVKDDGFRPDFVLIIPNGGKIPGEIIKNELTILFNNDKIKLGYVDIHRFNTKIPENRLLKRFPKKLLNLLRIISLKLKKLNLFTIQSTVSFSIPDDSNNILIVDDAIDTGRTMKKILESPVFKDNSRQVRTAVLNTTMVNQLINPDYCLFYNTILRLPWARDSK